MGYSNMDLSHAPVPAAQWSRRPPVWSTQYASSGLDTGVHSYPGFEVPVAAMTSRPDGEDDTSWFSGQKLVAGAIGLGLVLGVTALMCVTSAISHDDDELETTASTSASVGGASMPTQATTVATTKPMHAKVESRLRPDWAFPEKDPEPETVAAPKEAAPKEPTHRPWVTTRRSIVKHPIPRMPSPSTKAADANDVAQARALLKVSNEETTLK